MIGMVDLSGKGSKIHGIVEEYVAKGNISTGGFVKYLNNYINMHTNTEISSNAYISKMSVISAVALDENRVFIVYTYQKNSNYLRGVICTINENAITVETDITLNTVDRNELLVSAVKLSENKIFITYVKFSSTFMLYGIVCTIDGTTITAGTNTLLVSDSSGFTDISAVALAENRVFIAYTFSRKQVVGVICTIDGTTISKGTEVKLTNVLSNSINIISAAKLSANKIFINYSWVYSGKYYLYGIECTINDNTITAGNSTLLVSENSSKAVNIKTTIVILSSNKIFNMCNYYSDTNKNYVLSGTVCTINNDDTITIGATILIDTSDVGISCSAVALDENRVFIVYYNKAIYEAIYTIDKNKINSNLIDIDINNRVYYISIMWLQQNKIFMTYGQADDTNQMLYGALIDYYNNTVQTATQADKIYRHSPK